MLLTVFLALLAASWIDPPYPDDLALQHAPTLIALVALAVAHRFRRFTALTLTLVFAFLVLHVLGARHLYSFVPYDAWLEGLLGQSLSDRFGWTRNHYDRFVHFCFGLLLAYPAHEVIQRSLKLPRGWSYCFSVQWVMAASLLYEVLEWQVAVFFAPDWADRYNGQQGKLQPCPWSRRPGCGVVGGEARRRRPGRASVRR